MKNRVLTFLALALSASMLVACNKEDGGKTDLIQALENENTGAELTKDERSQDLPAQNPQGETIQEELAAIQSKADALAEAYDTCDTQMDMNENAAERYKLWDDELNLLWSRLSDEMSEDAKADLLAQQREWIKRKELAVSAAGMAGEGGSIQPLLEHRTAANLTEVRVYQLAASLAKLRGEEFVVSDELQSALDEMDPSVDKVFAYFEGQHIFDMERGACIDVERIENSPFCAEDFPEGTTWVVSVSAGDVLTNKDVYSFSSDSILFHKESGEYVEMYENMAGGVTLAYGETPDALEDAISSDD